MLYGNCKWTHRTGTPIDDHVCPCHVAAETTCQEAYNASHFRRDPRTLKPNMFFLRLDVLSIYHLGMTWDLKYVVSENDLQ